MGLWPRQGLRRGPAQAGVGHSLRVSHQSLIATSCAHVWSWRRPQNSGHCISAPATDSATSAQVVPSVPATALQGGAHGRMVRARCATGLPTARSSWSRGSRNASPASLRVGRGWHCATRQPAPTALTDARRYRISAFTPKRSLVRSQYRPPLLKAPDLQVRGLQRSWGSVATPRWAWPVNGSVNIARSGTSAGGVAWG